MNRQVAKDAKKKLFKCYSTSWRAWRPGGFSLLVRNETRLKGLFLNPIQKFPALAHFGS
jgi:hypothetical protein